MSNTTIISPERLCDELLAENSNNIKLLAILLSGYNRLFKVLEKPGEISKVELNTIMTETLDEVNQNVLPHV